jgi:hypothetical protein
MTATMAREPELSVFIPPFPADGRYEIIPRINGRDDHCLWLTPGPFGQGIDISTLRSRVLVADRESAETWIRDHISEIKPMINISEGTDAD